MYEGSITDRAAQFLKSVQFSAGRISIYHFYHSLILPCSLHDCSSYYNLWKRKNKQTTNNYYFWSERQIKTGLYRHYTEIIAVFESLYLYTSCEYDNMRKEPIHRYPTANVCSVFAYACSTQTRCCSVHSFVYSHYLAFSETIFQANCT